MIDITFAPGDQTWSFVVIAVAAATINSDEVKATTPPTTITTKNNTVHVWE